jgi:beta-RFAP synthase
MRDCVTVAAAARLHLGFLDLHGGLGRRFGSLGLALDGPETRIDVSRCARNRVEGPQTERAILHLKRVVDHLEIGPGHFLQIREAIPAHAGLGSGTQLALAIAAAVRRLHGIAPDIDADALLLDRSARSGLGVAFFRGGGLALDAGRGSAEAPAPIISRLPFPENWRVLLILELATEGVHGPDEVAAFKTLPAFPAELAAHLCRLALMRALPAVAERDLPTFARAVTEIQAHVGDYFAPAQGGRYASGKVAAVLDLLAANGAIGYGQSSWGPTGFVFAGSDAEAQAFRDRAAPLAASSGLTLRIATGRNDGATITAHAQMATQGARHG